MKGFSGFKASPAKNMKTGKYSQSFESPAKKELIGGQNNLPEELKAKIEAAPGKMYDKSPAKQEGPVPKKNIKLQKGEMEGTYIYEGKDKSERMIDLEERAGFLTDNDITNDGSKEDNQRIKTAKKLQHEADIIRNRKPKSKSTNIKPGYTDGKRDKSKDKIHGVKGPLGPIKK